MKFDITSTQLPDRIISKAHRLPACVHELIFKVVRAKSSTLEVHFFSENECLPKPLQIINLNNKILSLNKEIELYKLEYRFDRLQEINRYEEEYKSEVDNEGEQENSMSTYLSIISKVLESEETKKLIEEKCNISKYIKPIEVFEIEDDYPFLIDSCTSILTSEEFEVYKQLDISERDIRKVVFFYSYGRKDPQIILPKFNTIVEYLSLVKFYDSLIQDYEDIQQGEEILPPTNKYRFKTNLTEQQLNLLFEGLLNTGFISPKTKQWTFLYIFGIGENDDVTTIKWLSAKSLVVYLIDSLENKKYLVNPKRKWSIAENVFGIKNAAQIKNSYSLDGRFFDKKPKDYEIIDAILSKA